MNEFTLPSDLSELLGPCKKIMVVTGAGISAESGLGTFRGKEGIWNKMRPEELASMEGFLANSKLVWEWYNYRRSVLAEARPNPAHRALAEWERSLPEFTVVTQNVDGLHQAAGSSRVLELHGSIRVNRCLKCEVESLDEPVRYENGVPYCVCGGKLRPGVVWFGEQLPANVLEQAFQLAQTCDLCLTIGTSAVVYPAASLPELAVEYGALTIEINIERTPFTPRAAFHLSAPASAAVPELLHSWRSQNRDSMTPHE